MPATIEELLERHHPDGLHVTTDIRGPRQALPRSVAGAAYRILQEALTNAARHGPGSAEVAVRSGAEALEITVTNPTPDADGAVDGTLASSGGHGVVGMRERATLLGGTLEASLDHGVFRLYARLPYSEPQP